jgi:OFA family oxalate/formate antiporter-like MFS transporter
VQTTRDYAWWEMLQSPVFWVMYLMFVLVGAGGLMATAQLAPIAKDFRIDAVPVSLIGITLPALTFALSIDRILNGITRPFFGWVSDTIGRENTMLIAFGLEAIGIWALSAFGRDPVMFVILSGLVFFAWGEIYSLFPSTCTDVYGVKYATTNAGLLYTAKGTASLLVPFGNVLAQATGSWQSVFLVAAAMNLAAALAAPLVLRPLRLRHQAAPATARPGRCPGPPEPRTHLRKPPHPLATASAAVILTSSGRRACQRQHRSIACHDRNAAGTARASDTPNTCHHGAVPALK